MSRRERRGSGCVGDESKRKKRERLRQENKKRLACPNGAGRRTRGAGCGRSCCPPCNRCSTKGRRLDLFVLKVLALIIANSLSRDVCLKSEDDALWFSLITNERLICCNCTDALIDMYSKCGCLDSAYQVSEKMPQRDVVAWNSMAAGCVVASLNSSTLKHQSIQSSVLLCK
ncbi:Pentatricopeptide repeat-containing protein [Nymphaea thermarum]|nr:Pentatricopeptide repeat-containing protein [Nymphaea thermarum]